MKGFRSLFGLALLCAIVGSAIVVQTAAAAFAKDTNSTFVTCAPEGGKKDFSDAHCDKSVTAGTGKFGHVKIAPKTSTPIVITNAKTASETTASTPAKFNWTLGGVAAELTASTVTGTGTIENLEPEKGKMTATGTVVVKYTGLAVVKPAGCKVAEPVEVKANLTAVSEGKKMGVEFSPSVAGANFTELKFENNGTEKCALNGTAVPVKGTAIATGGAGNEAAGSGATRVFEPGNGMESLKVGTVEATFTSTTTTRMAPVEGVEQNPIAVTTGAE